MPSVSLVSSRSAPLLPCLGNPPSIVPIQTVFISQGVPSYVRFYRDFSVADFTFCTISTLFVTFASFSYYTVRSRICEELSRHGDLMRGLGEMGLSSENCEQWFERGVLVFVGVMFVVIVVRVSEPFRFRGRELTRNIAGSCQRVVSQLHLLVVVSNYYQQLARISRDYPPSKLHKDSSLQRIYLLPNPAASASRSDPRDRRLETTALVYAPVALSDLSESEVQGLNAREAWVHTNPPHPPRQHRHSHSRGHRHSSGRIALPIQPEEGLLRGHEKYKD